MFAIKERINKIKNRKERKVIRKVNLICDLAFVDRLFNGLFVQELGKAILKIEEKQKTEGLSYDELASKYPSEFSLIFKTAQFIYDSIMCFSNARKGVGLSSEAIELL